MKLRLIPVRPKEDGGTGHRWVAALDSDEGSPMYDGSGVTVEEALVDLVDVLGRVLDREAE